MDWEAIRDGRWAPQYLGRYLYLGVISERDILRCTNGQGTYRWRDAKCGGNPPKTHRSEK